MTALQKAFSRHEKIRRMLANLEELKNNDEVDADKYAQMKTEYEALLETASENLKSIRNQMKGQRQQAQEILNKLQADASAISTRGKVGELSPEKVIAELGAIQSKKDVSTKSLQQYDGWLAARSSADVGGYVDVNVNETVEYQPESVMDWGKVAGNIGERAKGLVGDKVAGFATDLIGNVKGAGGGNLKKRLPTIIGVCVGVLLVVFLGYKMLGKRSSVPTLKEKTIMQVIQKKLDKEPVYHDVELSPQLNPDILREMAQAGLVVATDPKMQSFRVATGMDPLVFQKDASQFGMAISQFVLHVAKADNIKIVRFTPPADANGIKVSYVEYRYEWKPTEILSSAKFQGLRDKMRKELGKAEGDIKMPVSEKAVLGMFTDGWALIEDK